MNEDPRSTVRERTRREVAVALAPRFRTCPECGEEDLTASRTCPHCGAPYTVVAKKRRVGARRALAGAAAAALLALVVVVVVAPEVDEDKRQSAEAEQQRLEAARAERNAAVREAQRPRTGSGRRPAGPPTVASRRALVTGVEAAIARDARARADAGELRGPILGVRCGPYPRRATGGGVEARLSERVGRYECLAATTRIRPTELNPAGAIGHPYLARVDFGSFRYAFCKVSPPPGEKAVPRPDAPEVPDACSAP